MGLHFGNLAKVRHVITFSLSPFEQKAFPNFFSKGIPNTWRRFRSNIVVIGIPMALVFLTCSWGNRVHEQYQRKNPADFDNDK